MSFQKRQIKDIYLSNTDVENIFITEYMANAPGEYVKIYLLSYMYADLLKEIDNAGIAKQLSLQEEDVLKAWTYWEGLGVIKKHYIDPKDKFHYNVEFISLKELLYSSRTKRGKAQAAEDTHPLSDRDLKNLYHSIERITGRLLGGKEPTEIISWITEYKAPPEVILYAYSFCAKNRKKDNHKYVSTVVKEWMEKGLTEVSAIDAHLQEVDRRHFLYKRVLKALGFTRNATEEEQRIMNTWFDEMEFPLERVLEACSKTSGIPNPNINYVNKILESWKDGKEQSASGAEGKDKKAVSVATVFRYYDMVRKKAEAEAEARKEQIYRQVPKIKEIDEQLRTCGMEISRMMISDSGDKKRQAAQFRTKVEALTTQKAELLVETGWEADALETKYRCRICKDSGTSDEGQRCPCFQQMQQEAEIWEKTAKTQS